jgi:hypothetical protein
MAKRAFLVPVALTVAALLGSLSASVASVPSTVIVTAHPEKVFEPTGNLVLERAGDQTVRMADHESHSSHESHASHSSHSSHVSGSF